ncbi:hypothetical protein Ddye_019657 [Dipteronia dyeriana]|uniref:Uncharacterized protein n=1 Tax=Dipteronia dyeriana TaxID=168575 RepID=A0AAD9WVY2_9ROSI|nr:hypothetical protein Ddye_019657 [Dipteronia dyeriana]
MDDDQMQALKELGRLNRKRKSQRIKIRPNYELYDGVSEFKKVKLKVGQVFASSKLFKKAIKEYAIRCGRVIWFPCNEKGRVKGICKGITAHGPFGLQELKKTNPGSTVVIDIELGSGDKNKFKRIYICFNSCKQGRLHGCGCLSCEGLSQDTTNKGCRFCVRHMYANFKKKFKDDITRGKCGRQQDQP